VFRGDNPVASRSQYAVNARWLNARPIRKGDVLLARWVGRATKARQESGEAEGMFTVDGAGERQMTQAFSIGPDWTVISAPFVATRDIAVGEALTRISFSQLEQTIEVAEFDIVNFENRIALDALPTTRFSYVGREPDAAWRKQALARIEAIRTAPIRVRVVDGQGRPVPDAKVDVAMTQPAFLWGSEVDADMVLAKGPDGDRYRQEIKALFDTVVIGNAMKWPRWIQPQQRQAGLASLDWLRAQGKRVKGHNLSWPGWKFTPQFVVDDPAKRDQIATLVDERIRELTAATRGKMIGWDVINEPVHETDWFKHMPRERVAEWFKLAKASDPAMQLTLNEYGMLNRSSSPLMIAEFLEFSRMLRRNGAPVDVLGVQGHVGQTPRPPVEVLKDLDLLAVDGQQVQITEFDFNTKDEALQADYTRDFLIALYSHRAVTGFIMWGFWEPKHWKPDAAMFRPDWSAKPNLAVWRDLVLNQWRTRFAAATGADGMVGAKGHLGRYKAVVTRGKQRGEAEFDLVPGGNSVEIRLTKGE
jgi:GH35 family endo-1,4-beta-xylanase